MSIYKDLLFLHGHLWDLSVVEDDEAFGLRKRADADRSEPAAGAGVRHPGSKRKSGLLSRMWLSLMARPR